MPQAPWPRLSEWLVHLAYPSREDFLADFSNRTSSYIAAQSRTESCAYRCRMANNSPPNSMEPKQNLQEILEYCSQPLNEGTNKEEFLMPMPTHTSGEREDRITGAIESQTAKIPSSGYLALAVGSMAVSAVLKAIGRDDWSLFVGQWAPAFLIIGVYNKIVKQQGSDAYSRAA
jgi:hypothetical protein